MLERPELVKSRTELPGLSRERTLDVEGSCGAEQQIPRLARLAEGAKSDVPGT